MIWRSNDEQYLHSESTVYEIKNKKLQFVL